MSTMQKQTYKELQNQIKLQLAHGVEAKKISVEELMSILFILGQTSTLAELEAFVDIFSHSFPVLKSVELTRRESSRGDLEMRVKKAVSKLVMKDPLLATQLAKDALKKDVTWEELVSKYPQLQDEE